jgi:pimeloyl-ACP methyl ester carboxylesterase
MMAGIEITEILVHGLTFQCRTSGPMDGKPVLLLHGWPETSCMWEPMMLRLASSGYRCIAPDLRGFSPGARPRSVEEYDIRVLVNDVMGLADAFGCGRFHLIGHDWGSAIGWATVALHSDRVITWSAMSVPHIRAFAEAIRTDAKQRRMSRYMGWFQFPWLPEWFLLRNGAKALRDIWRKSSPEQVQAYLKVLGNRDGLRASLNYYRANYPLLAKGEEVNAFGDIQVPTLMLYGRRDFAIGPIGVRASEQFMKGPYRLVELDATHWLVQEAPNQCIEEVLTHLSSADGRG